jgi:hypothetical protein
MHRTNLQKISLYVTNWHSFAYYKTKIKHHEKLLLIAAIASFTFACNDGSKSSSSTTDTATVAPAALRFFNCFAHRALKDGLMTMKDGKMMIVKGGAWVAMEAPVTCTNGRKVDLTGEVSKGDKKRKLEEGMMTDKDGQIKDKDGKLVDTSGWD